ncbi:hypothetical protein ONZ45_g15021 [Pleurotus djamor]|nr:hypothetical protein ONZ45_g15021 [Pleurotus djamor]
MASDSNHALTKRILWKLDCRILPPLALLWLANFIDRSNIGNARIAGLERDTHLHGNQFNIILAGTHPSFVDWPSLPHSTYAISYITTELPSNWVIKRVGANRWIPILVCLWGVVTTLTSLVHSFAGLVVVRMCLGILYLSTVYKRHELQLRVGIFYASASLSGAFGGLLATAISKMDGIGGLAGWRWIFVLEGIATVLFGLIAAVFLPGSIETAKFLSEEERVFALQRFRMDDVTASAPPAYRSSTPASSQETEKAENVHVHDASPQVVQSVSQEDEEFEWSEVLRGVMDIQVWLTGLAYFGLITYHRVRFRIFWGASAVAYRFTLSVRLHLVPPYVPAVVLTVIVAILSDRLKWRGPFILICLPLAIIGYIVAITAQTNTGRYAAVFLMASGVYPSAPCILSILPNNSSGHYKKATTTALQLAVANTGGFVATFIYTSDQAPRYIRGHSISLAFLVLAWVLTAANVVYCMWENKARQQGRRQHNIAAYEALWELGKTRAPIGDRHPDFRFTL